MLSLFKSFAVTSVPVDVFPGRSIYLALCIDGPCSDCFVYFFFLFNLMMFYWLLSFVLTFFYFLSSSFGYFQYLKDTLKGFLLLA